MDDAKTDVEATTSPEIVTNNPLIRRLIEAVERSGLSVIITDASASALYRSKHIRNSLPETLTLGEDGRLRALSVNADQALRENISELAGNSAREHRRSPFLLPSVRLDGLLMAGLRVPTGVETMLNVVLVLAAKEARSSEKVALTRAETQLLHALVRGKRLHTYAKETGIALSTAKTHLRGLFDKFGERRQADLILKVLSNPAYRSLLMLE